MIKKKRVAIVGAGVGGLATAARLASRGYSVDVYEKLDRCGGRAHIIEDKGFFFDTGPSFVLMPDFFEEVFSYCGKNLKDYLDLKILDVSYKIFYSDGAGLAIYKDKEKTKDALERIEKGSAKAYECFLKETGAIYQAVRPLLYKCFTKKDMLDPAYWGLLRKLKVPQTYWSLAKKYFKSEKLCYAFTFEAMFIGVSPFATPAFYSMITYTDHAQKIAYPMGGMYQIPKSLERLCLEFGARLHYNAEVAAIEKDNGAFFLKTAAGSAEAEAVVVNADYAHAVESLLKKKLPRFTYSCSVYLLYLGLKKKISGLEHHNLFFSDDVRKNLKQIFDQGVIPDDPSFYIHVPTVTDPGLAPPGKDIVYILIPVPNLGVFRQKFAEHEPSLRRAVFGVIDRTLGISLQDLIEVEHCFYPHDFVSRYNIKNGATFGLAHTLMQSAFFRPANFDSRVKDLYFVGASTQPGGGLPPVIAGSRIVADLIMNG
jgi:phytoene desaturase